MTIKKEFADACPKARRIAADFDQRDGS